MTCPFPSQKLKFVSKKEICSLITITNMFVQIQIYKKIYIDPNNAPTSRSSNTPGNKARRHLSRAFTSPDAL